MPLTWFITGCSSGFGESLVRQLRDAGDNVIATGRNADIKLAHLKDTGAEIIELDVTAPVGAIKAVADRAWGIYGGIDVVVNNAGFILSGPVEEQTLVLQIPIRDSLTECQPGGYGEIIWSQFPWSYEYHSCISSISKEERVWNLALRQFPICLAL
jgi:NAD(P)-dependent dehydrogenase (short-subunit alcohol dehydrogenase family)